LAVDADIAGFRLCAAIVAAAGANAQIVRPARKLRPDDRARRDAETAGRGAGTRDDVVPWLRRAETKLRHLSVDRGNLFARHVGYSQVLVLRGADLVETESG